MIYVAVIYFGLNNWQVSAVLDNPKQCIDIAKTQKSTFCVELKK